ncbi:hypothetical protein SMD20_47520 [Nonomuraea sp. LP-02]|uniref:alpha/beta fold hydrolase n=1 Tax=Nonomuraea sp. LP-02 TaxID=3097960 RepID=UPI002E34E29E|nr:hypothetical protein [Nonomuraea sp. LP-02]MED7931944.1 hypothetical protein [Nonomuraea sp. LP-02]
MHDELGFRRYAAHGGDLGAGITSRLAEAHPEAVVGIHLLAAAAPAGYDPAGLTSEEQTYLASAVAWQAEEGGYLHQQNTRPLTLAPALADSPAGLLATPRRPSTGSRAPSRRRSGPTTSTRTT